MHPKMLIDFFVYDWMVGWCLLCLWMVGWFVPLFAAGWLVFLPLFAVACVVSLCSDADNITFLHIFPALTISLVSVDKGIL